ncbi:hypothetical protein L484_021417 [Morus notabilis]|uniref:Uncharacterized protein n=1 Tax=Morus notabilis TaxID=981085 RepID=W9RPN8_9ROSA|nr:hypothetical protein L484_021417 [Morus notabilis]
MLFREWVTIGEVRIEGVGNGFSEAWTWGGKAKGIAGEEQVTGLGIGVGSRGGKVVVGVGEVRGGLGRGKGRARGKACCSTIFSCVLESSGKEPLEQSSDVVYEAGRMTCYGSLVLHVKSSGQARCGSTLDIGNSDSTKRT